MENGKWKIGPHKERKLLMGLKWGNKNNSPKRKRRDYMNNRKAVITNRRSLIINAETTSNHHVAYAWVPSGAPPLYVSGG